MMNESYWVSVPDTYSLMHSREEHEQEGLRLA